MRNKSHLNFSLYTQHTQKVSSKTSLRICLLLLQRSCQKPVGKLSIYTGIKRSYSQNQRRSRRIQDKAITHSAHRTSQTVGGEGVERQVTATERSCKLGAEGLTRVFDAPPSVPEGAELTLLARDTSQYLVTETERRRHTS